MSAAGRGRNGAAFAVAFLTRMEHAAKRAPKNAAGNGKIGYG